MRLVSPFFTAAVLLAACGEGGRTNRTANTAEPELTDIQKPPQHGFNSETLEERYLAAADAQDAYRACVRGYWEANPPRVTYQEIQSEDYVDPEEKVCIEERANVDRYISEGLLSNR